MSKKQVAAQKAVDFPMAETGQECLNEEDKKLSNEQTYDAALASMLSKLKNYIIPLINEVFGEKYTERAEVVLRNNKHVIHRIDGTLARRDSDSVIDLFENPILKISKSYLFECEAWYDKTIVVRINEYDTSVTIENAQLTDEEVILTHPHSAIIFLHPNKNIPPKNEDHTSWTLRRGNVVLCFRSADKGLFS